jgi:glutathione-independent formaldehyde dehydrogenase
MMNASIASTKATGGIGVVGVFVPPNLGRPNELGKQGKMAFGFGAFWPKGQQIRTGQAGVKAYNRLLSGLIHAGEATPSKIIAHRLSLAKAPDAYKKFDARDKGRTKVVLRPAA